MSDHRSFGRPFRSHGQSYDAASGAFRMTNTLPQMMPTTTSSALNTAKDTVHTLVKDALMVTWVRSTGPLLATGVGIVAEGTVANKDLQLVTEVVTEEVSMLPTTPIVGG